MRIKFGAGRETADPEKAVLPALVFCSAQHPSFAEHQYGGGALSLGWWDWYVRIAIFWGRARQDSKTD